MFEESISRREFVKKAGQIAATPLLALGASAASAAAASSGAPVRRRYALVGTGERACFMWGGDLVRRYGDVVEFAGLCDINSKRVGAAKAIMGVECPTFTNFDEMCDRVKPDVVIVTTVDAFHSGYIVNALDRGIDVITEKPMVIDETQCQAVLDAEKRNNRKIVVTFNMRYPPKHQKIKELLLAGEIGRVISVDFNWYLDVFHGADYFQRCHDDLLAQCLHALRGLPRRVQRRARTPRGARLSGAALADRGRCGNPVDHVVRQARRHRSAEGARRTRWRRRSPARSDV